MNIPLKYLTKMGVYDIQMNGDNVKVRVADQATVVESGLEEIKSRVVGDLKLVGIDLKEGNCPWHPLLLLVYVRDFCLIIHLGSIPLHRFPQTLASFLSDKNVCFVGFQIDSVLNNLTNYLNLYYDRMGWSVRAKGVDTRDLAARVLKNPALQGCNSLADLVTKSEFEFKETDDDDQNETDDDDQDGKECPDQNDKECPDWRAPCFSTEEVKHAIREAYISFHMASKHLSML